MATPRLPNRKAIVTGSSSGLGRAIALAYGAEGAWVMCVDLQPGARAEFHEEYPVATHELITERGGKAGFRRVDVGKEGEVRELVEEVGRVWGRLDIIVNNAGIAPEVPLLALHPGGLRAHETPMSVFDRTIEVNLRATFLGCKYALAQFLRQEPLPANSRGDETRGWIVNTASLAGVVALPGAPAYTTSKHAVVGLTRQLGVDYARERVHCNALCPTFTDTPLIACLLRDSENPVAVETTKALKALHPWGQFAQVEDVARAAVFLVSEDSQYITATNLLVDGGYSGL
ncbi:hypothetical protein HYALB_00004086 [Hymenoscyphus albidus]|uniref:NAD(P)-binding protein n=1 Tax=Hymenoscyphus albidus TaxID=595503 RepID=A0A9N9Q8A0_9HELO|nr:hypothetical protein HYALB_00004086 [Hymenoscyphus albidus]